MASFYKKFIQHKSLSFQEGSTVYDYRFLLSQIQETESLFLNKGVQPGDLLVLAGPNSYWHIIVFLAAEKLGLLLCFLYDGLSSADKERQVAELNPNWVLEVVQGDLQLKSSGSSRGNYAGCIFQTSGTTGIPGYIFHSFESLYKNAEIASAGQGIDQDSRVLALLPFSHVGGWSMQLTAAILTGANLELAAGNSMAAFLSQLRNATHGIIVPSFFKRLCQSELFQQVHFENRPLIVTGSTVVSDELIKDLMAKGCHVQVVYGLTEVGPYVCVADGVYGTPDGCVSILGKPRGEYSMRINEKREEIEIKGPTLGKAFLPKKRETVPLCGQDGFLATGDLGKKIDDTYYFQGRIKNIIVVGGLKVNASELEKIILEIPEVTQCVVLPEPHSMLGEVPVAYVVRVPGKEVDISKFLQSRVSRFKMPRRIRYVDVLPETSIGKSRRVKNEIVED